ncbi:50S ribosomal protein L21 [Pseudomonadota bacterium]
MFAVVEIGGKQYKVQQNEQIDVELLGEEAGKTVKFDTVILVSDKDTKIGQPYVQGATVEAKVVEEVKGDKLRVFRMTPKKRFQRTQGHRQKYTRLEITNIKA